MKKTVVTIITLAVIAGMVALLIGNKKKVEKQTSSSALTDMTELVSTITVVKSPITHEFSSNAMVQALRELNFVSEISGRVIEVCVDNGAKVRQGSPLLKIDSELIEADYKAALAAYNAMTKDAGRFTRSNEAGGISDQQLDNIRTQLLAAESRLKASKWRLDNAVVKSPISGTINMRYVEKGSLIAPNAPLFEIVDDSSLKMVCMVPENRIGRVHVGGRVEAQDSGSSGAVFTGKVRNIGVKTDRGLNYPVEVLMDPDAELRIGMYLRARFIEDRTAEGILVPRKAVVGSALAANVFLAVDGKAVRREVKLGDMYGSMIEVTEGLEEGEALIVSGLMNVSDGTEIRIVEQ